MAPNRIPGPLGSRSTRGFDEGTLCRAPSPSASPVGTGATRPGAADADLIEMRELGLDMVQMAFDLAGIVDPTPVSDGTSGMISLARGKWLDAVISGASMVPYIGDLAKAGKLPRYLKSVEKAVALAERSSAAAMAMLPGMEKLKAVLDLIPAGANQQIDRIRGSVGRFLALHGPGAAVKALPDISKSFAFREFTQGDKTYRVAKGRLGVPGMVKKHPSASARRNLSGGTGDDAGHLIAAEFGGPGTAENLSLQNWKSNRAGGTYRDLELEWGKKLKEGAGVEVTVTDVTIKGKWDDRPFMRKVEWTEVALDGSRKSEELLFHNAKFTKPGGPTGGAGPGLGAADNVFPVDFANKTKSP